MLKLFKRFCCHFYSFLQVFSYSEFSQKLVNVFVNIFRMTVFPMMYKIRGSSDVKSPLLVSLLVSVSLVDEK